MRRIISTYRRSRNVGRKLSAPQQKQAKSLRAAPHAANRRSRDLDSGCTQQAARSKRLAATCLILLRR